MDGRYLSDLRDCSIELNRIKSWINSNPFDSNVRYLISYSVIKASGTIERILKSILFDHVSQGANSEAVNYFSKHITEASFNPSPGAIERILSDFDNSWGVAFKNAISGAQQKGDLKSLVQLRNDFAHGTAITPSIETVLKYYISGVWILNEVCKIVV
jgi:hypothetical protein